MLVKDVMSRGVITISKYENMVELIAKFRKYNYHTLPVIDESKKLLGVVSSEDIMKIFLPHNPLLDNLLRSTHLCDLEEDDILEMDLPSNLGITVTVSDIMNTDVIAIEEDKTIADARKKMKLHDIERIPVTRNNTLVGFITLFDIIIAIFKERNVID
ncbi:MAG: CBS domain-containing protein [Planctomycetota bacterium]